jgi:threonine dehydratase
MFEEVLAHAPELDTIVVAAGGGGLFAGVATAAEQHGVRVVVVEPEHCRALNAAIEAGRVVDVPVRSVAADSLGARRATPLALRVAQRADVVSVLVDDDAVVRARQVLWSEYRLAVEHAAATAYAAIADGSYVAQPDERVAIVLCGANTDPSDLGGSR